MSFWDWGKKPEEFCGGCNFEIKENEELFKRKDGKYYCSDCKDKIIGKTEKKEPTS